MADLRDILPFGLYGYEPQSQWLAPGYSHWEHATAFQLLRLLKLLGVEQQSIANHLNVTVSSISMWINGHRGTPDKYRPALRAYAAVMLEKAVERLHKELETLPQPLRRAAHLEFSGRLRRWGLEIQHADGILHKTIQEECRQIGAYADYETLPREERPTLRRLCKTIQIQLRTLDALEESTQAQTQEPSTGESDGEK